MKTFLANSPIIVQLKSIIYDGWDARCKGETGIKEEGSKLEKLAFFMEIRGSCSNFALEE